MTAAVFVDCQRRDLLQSFRAQQAIGEAGYPILVPTGEMARWEYAARWFAIPFSPLDGVGRGIPVTIDHESPAVAVGSLTRPLLFPHAVVDQFRATWSTRSVRASFLGNLSRERRRILNDWASQNSSARTIKRLPNVVIKNNRAGRFWPQKAWDPHYAALLGSSQFVLCPNGRHVWTYRFFEAAMAGAIPVIESSCSHYDGFIYHSMNEPLATMVWSSNAAEQNAERVRSLLTAPSGDIRAAVDTLRGV